MSSLPAHLYKSLEEKIPEGDVTDQVFQIIEGIEWGSPPPLKDLPGLKDLLIPQELFAEFELSTGHCMFQTNGTSKGIIKQARVIKYTAEELQFVVVDAGDNGFPGELVAITIPDTKMNVYNIIGNLLCKRK